MGCIIILLLPPHVFAHSGNIMPSYATASSGFLLSTLAVCALMTASGCTSARPAFTQTASAEEPKVQQASFQGSGESGSEGVSRWITTDTGLKYRIIKKGNGRYPNANNKVTVNYRGWLDNGKEFDSSFKRNAPATFPLRNVVPGWTEGLTYVDKGGAIELEIPYLLGYGAQGKPPTIPPKATLHFYVELLDIM